MLPAVLATVAACLCVAPACVSPAPADTSAYYLSRRAMLPAVLATVAACLCVAPARASPADTRAYYPLKYATYTNPKTIQTILTSIDERLRILDAVSLEQAQQARRLDAIHQKIEILEATVSVRLQQAELATNRLEHRIHMLQTSMQSELDATSARLDRSQERVSAAAVNLTTNMESHRHLLEKASGTYGETWRRALILEGLTRDGLALVNVTRRELADGLRSLARRQRDYRLSAQDLESALSDTTTSFTKRLNEQTHKLDKKIEAVMTAQEHFLDSCHRIQKDEPHLDTHVADVIDKLLDTVINKTATIFHKLQLVQTEVRSHDTKVARALSRSAQPSDGILRKIETILRNTSAPPPPVRDAELQKLTDKFIDLTNRADAALQRLDARLAATDEPADTSDVTAAADKLIDKLEGINSEEEYDDYDDPSAEFFEDGGGGRPADSAETAAEAERREPSTARPPHRRHLHKHPYDRGPHRSEP